MWRHTRLDRHARHLIRVLRTKTPPTTPSQHTPPPPADNNTEDLATAAPKAGLDALYAALALVLGATALQERGALAARAEEAQAAAAAAAAQEERQRGE